MTKQIKDRKSLEWRKEVAKKNGFKSQNTFDYNNSLTSEAEASSQLRLLEGKKGTTLPLNETPGIIVFGFKTEKAWLIPKTFSFL